MMADVTGGCDVTRIEALERAGLTPSRNKHFAFWSEPGNRRLLSLWRFVVTLARELRERHATGALRLELTGPGADGRFWLVLRMPPMRAARRVPLTRAELAFLMRQEGVAQVFAELGLPLEMGEGRGDASAQL